MRHILAKTQQGFGHLQLIVLVLVIAAAGLGWWVMRSNPTPGEKTLDLITKNAKCVVSDKSLCAFLLKHKVERPYNLTTIAKQDEAETKTVLRWQSSSRFATQVTGPTAYEVVVIDNTLYTKAADGTWWQQTVAQDDVAKYKSTAPQISQPGKDVSYKKVGTEACGTATCLKYEAIRQNGNKDNKQYVWFDTTEYLVRRAQTTAPTNMTDSLFDYKTVKIDPPANTKVLGANQTLTPGQSQPTSLPGTGDPELTPEQIEQLRTAQE